MQNQIVLAALADVNSEAREDAKKKYGINVYADYKEMIEKENLDAVSVVTPDFLHEEITLYCAAKKLHLALQKPLDVTVEGAERMVKAAAENNVMLFVDFHKRFDPSLILLRERYRTGKLGELLYGYANIEDAITVPADWFKGWAQNSSPMWFIGIHLIDIFNWIFDKPPVKVLATGGKKKLLSLGIDSYDFIQAKLVYDNGAAINLDTSWILPRAFPSIVDQTFRFIGTEGIMEVDGQNRGIEYYSSFDGGSMDNPYGYHVLEEENALTGCNLSGYTVDTMLHFPRLLQKLDQGATLESLAGTYADGPQAVLATRIAVAIHESVEKGGVWVTI